ncbi:hypothetical protein GCM10008942_09410 [Rhizomicrobium electricum]|uniref:Uncharacterized protein n=1 Tax=Rhizomicrobium electricum TaxID=480070 RepID=A0ABP3PDD7_9PROT
MDPRPLMSCGGAIYTSVKTGTNPLPAQMLQMRASTAKKQRPEENGRYAQWLLGPPAGAGLMSAISSQRDDVQPRRNCIRRDGRLGSPRFRECGQ